MLCMAFLGDGGRVLFAIQREGWLLAQLDIRTGVVARA